MLFETSCEFYQQTVSSLKQRKPSRNLLVQSQQGKHQNNVWNLFKVNNKDTRTTSVKKPFPANIYLFNDVGLVFLLLT